METAGDVDLSGGFSRHRSRLLASTEAQLRLPQWSEKVTMTTKNSGISPSHHDPWLVIGPTIHPPPNAQDDTPNASRLLLLLLLLVLLLGR